MRRKSAALRQSGHIRYFGAPGPAPRLLEDGVELRPAHLELGGVGVDPLDEGVILAGVPAAFERAAIVALAVQIEIEGIFQIDELGMGDRILGQIGGNEDHAFALGQHQIARQHGGAADADGRIDRGQGHVLPGGGIIGAVEPVDVLQLAIFLRVADAGIEDKAGMGMGGDARAQIGADQGAFHDLAEAVGDIHVADREFGDRPAVVAADPALRAFLPR